MCKLTIYENNGILFNVVYHTLKNKYILCTYYTGKHVPVYVYFI